MYDLIGDIHGHADELVRLLERLGYRRSARAYVHPERQVIFLGDYLDRGPQIGQVIAIVRGMVEAGSALAILGNHELNALAFHTPVAAEDRQFARPHTPRNVAQHRATLDQLASDELAETLAWLRTLPLWLELPGLRAIHACWRPSAMAVVERAMTRLGGLSAGFLEQAYDGRSPLFHAIEVLLKGPELPLPGGICYTDKDGHMRNSMRLRWFLPPAGHTYRTYSLQSAEIDCDQPLPAEVLATAEPYPADAPPVFVGHYWLRPQPPCPLAANVACLDYSVARGGFLTGYRWQGERVLDAVHFVTEAAAGTH